MIVCIDSGNTRIKWAVHEGDGRGWLDHGAVGHEQVADLAALMEKWPAPKKVVLANVAGPLVADRIRQVLRAWPTAWHEVAPAACGFGITNLYQRPESLGVDRWCAMIGAWQLVQSPVLVVMAGTATTIDTVDGAGVFRGGLIMPGIDLMRRSLAQGTADLPMTSGVYQQYPRSTVDAISSGILEAHAGAIERAYRRLESAEKSCLLSGGNAVMISVCLEIPHRVVENLPAEGMLRIAKQN